MKDVPGSMPLLRTIAAPLRRLRLEESGQAVVTYAVVACLFAAALVIASSVWSRDSMLADHRFNVERSR